MKSPVDTDLLKRTFHIHSRLPFLFLCAALLIWQLCRAVSQCNLAKRLFPSVIDQLCGLCSSKLPYFHSWTDPVTCVCDSGIADYWSVTVRLAEHRKPFTMSFVLLESPWVCVCVCIYIYIYIYIYVCVCVMSKWIFGNVNWYFLLTHYIKRQK